MILCCKCGWAYSLYLINCFVKVLAEHAAVNQVCALPDLVPFTAHCHISLPLESRSERDASIQRRNAYKLLYTYYNP